MQNLEIANNGNFRVYQTYSRGTFKSPAMITEPIWRKSVVHWGYSKGPVMRFFVSSLLILKKLLQKIEQHVIWGALTPVDRHCISIFHAESTFLLYTMK